MSASPSLLFLIVIYIVSSPR